MRTRRIALRVIGDKDFTFCINNARIKFEWVCLRAAYGENGIQA